MNEAVGFLNHKEAIAENIVSEAFKDSPPIKAENLARAQIQARALKETVTLEDKSNWSQDELDRAQAIVSKMDKILEMK